MDLSVCRQLVGDVLVVSAVGELDGGTAERLTDELELALDTMPATIVVNLGDVTFIDSTGVHAVMRKRAAMVSLETSLHVVAASEQVRAVFAMTGLADGMPLHRTLREALAAVAASPLAPA